jgi:hypothetical protein
MQIAKLCEKYAAFAVFDAPAAILVRQAVSPAFRRLGDFCHGLLI